MGNGGASQVRFFWGAPFSFLFSARMNKCRGGRAVTLLCFLSGGGKSVGNAGGTLLFRA